MVTNKFKVTAEYAHAITNRYDFFYSVKEGKFITKDKYDRDPNKVELTNEKLEKLSQDHLIDPIDYLMTGINYFINEF